MLRRNLVIFAVVVCLLASLPAGLSARERETERGRPSWYWSNEDFERLEIPDFELLRAAAQVDTYNIVYYDFDSFDWQGWTRVDWTAQPGTFWHVEDYLEPELAGFPGPLEGAKSAWCGALSGDDEYMCGWNAAPGYGNSWKQWLVSDSISIIGPVTLSYRAYVDSEEKYDQLHVQYDRGEGEWAEIVVLDDVIDTVAVHTILIPQPATKFRFYFESDGAWSDEDGLYTTDGAAHIDSITIADLTGLIDFEDFESAADGDLSSGIWHALADPGFGIYSGLVAGLQDKDPCNFNLSTQVVFFMGSDIPSSDYPGLYDTPFCKGEGGHELPCQSEVVVSPIIDMTKYSTNRDEFQNADIPPGALSDLAGVHLRFTVYADLPLQNLVFYNWNVHNVENGCPRGWLSRDAIGYYQPTREYVFRTMEIGDLIYADSMQVSLEIRDMCGYWYLQYGACAEHSPTPWFDNVWVRRYDLSGPQWSVRELCLFQDNFPEDEGDVESYVRADMANDLAPGDEPYIRPGDSIVVRCTSPIGGGIAEDGNGPRVYMHVKCTYIGDPDPPYGPKPPLSGPQLEGTYGTYVGDDGTWTVIQGDSARYSSGHWAPDHYMFDLNDSLFTRGYMIEYYFEAYDNAGKRSLYPHWAESAPQYPQWNGSYLFEFTCLPTMRTSVLYVDNFHGIGSAKGVAQEYIDATVRALFGVPGDPEFMPFEDRYDVNASNYTVGNGLESRAKLPQLLLAYNGIIWDSGYKSSATIPDGTDGSDKSNDCQLLVDWMANAPDSAALWVMGDYAASDLDGLSSPQASALLNDWCGVTPASWSYLDLTGGQGGGGTINPLITGAAGSIFDHSGDPDSFYIFGGCPRLNDFDVLGKTGSGEYALQYPDYNGESYYAAVQSDTVNGNGAPVHTMWFGFSFMYIRDGSLAAPIIRNHLMADVLEWWRAGPGHKDDYTGDGTPVPANFMGQNFPNPFNPVTTIRFGVKVRGPVELKIYNVEGKLVATLLDDVLDAGAYDIPWSGRNDNGSNVASGVYFYRIAAGDFVQTKKMVVLR